MRKGYMIGIRTKEIVLYRNGRIVESITRDDKFHIGAINYLVNDWIDYSWTWDGKYMSGPTVYYSIGPE